jgi:hypothetical protein
MVRAPDRREAKFRPSAYYCDEDRGGDATKNRGVAHLWLHGVHSIPRRRNHTRLRDERYQNLCKLFSLTRPEEKLVSRPCERKVVAGVLWLTLVTAAVVFGSGSSQKPSISTTRTETQAAQHSAASDEWLAVPGLRVGPLSLGDTEQRIPELFPKRAITQTRIPNCGMEYLIGILVDAMHPGSLSVFAKDGRVVEITTSMGHYHTEQGIASGSSPR